MDSPSWPDTADTVVDAEPLQAKSLQERMRERRLAIEARSTVVISLPGYGGEMVCRYHLLPATGPGLSLDAIARKVQEQSHGTEVEQAVVTAIDVLIAACDGVYRRDLETGDLLPLDEDNPAPMRYTQQLADWLGFPTDPVHLGRSVVRGVFGGNEHAIGAHGAKLMAWFNDTTIQVDDAYWGER